MAGGTQINVLEEKMASSFLKIMIVFWFEQYKKCFYSCLSCKRTLQYDSIIVTKKLSLSRR